MHVGNSLSLSFSYTHIHGGGNISSCLFGEFLKHAIMKNSKICILDVPFLDKEMETWRG